MSLKNRKVSNYCTIRLRWTKSQIPNVKQISKMWLRCLLYGLATRIVLRRGKKVLKKTNNHKRLTIQAATSYTDYRKTTILLGFCQIITRIMLVLAITSFSFLSSKDIRISGANRAEYWVFTDDRLDSLNYKEHLTEKLKLSVSYKDLTLKGVFFFWDPSVAIPGELQYFDYTAQYRKDPVNILYGTYYTTFGRGLCLNQFLDEDFNNDNSLYGLKADFKFLNSRLTLLTGKPRNIFFEELAYSIRNDTTDQIRGTNFETKLPPLLNTKVTLGGRYVRINRISDLTPKAFTELFGGNVGLAIGPWESYLEYGRQWGTKPVVGGRSKGEGMIFTTGLALPGLGISCQYVDYDNIGFGGFGYRYNEPPTPIKSGISVNRGIDEIGYGVSFVVSPFEFASLELENNKVTTHDDNLNKLEQTISINDDMDGVFEQTIKIITHPSFDLEITGGIERLVKQGIELPIEKKIETKPYIELTYDFGPLFVEAGYEHNLVSSDTSDYYDHAVAFSLGKPELFVLSVRYERRNRVPEWLISKLGEDRAWPMLELSLDLTHRHNLRLRAGAEKGGLVCSGGVCRFEEPFRGVKLVLTSIF